MNNVLESLIGIISPKLAFERAQYIQANNLKRSYDGAAMTTRTQNWKTSGASANTEIRIGLQLMRDRSRELIRNNPYARRAMRQVYTNVIGPGIKPSFNSKQKLSNKRIKDLWSDWAETTKCDFDGEMNFYSIQKLIMRTVFQSGEVLIRMRWSKDKGLPVPLQLQVLEADFIDHQKDTMSLDPNGNFTMQGIQFDKNGRRLGYWLFETHPGENAVNTRFVSNFVPADEIVHVYFKDRPGQIRGVSELVSVMVRIKDFDDYESAELVKQKIAACFVAFTHGTGEGLGSAKTGTKADNYEMLEPGMIIDLPSDKGVSFANPPTNNGHESYTKTNLRGMAAGIGVTYEGMTGDFSQVNFSSGRMGWLEFHKIVSDYQDDMIIPMCNRVYERFTKAAVIAGRLREVESSVRASWTCPRREMIDPVKESKAITEQLRNGTLAWQEAIRQQGDDVEVVKQQLIDDKKMFDEIGLMPTSDPRFDPTRADPNAQVSANKDTQKSKKKKNIVK